MNVLIVEDNVATADMLEEMLRVRDGYHVVSARSGEEALTRRVVWTPQVVLLDVMLPGITSAEFLLRLRTVSTNDGFPPAPVILSSALPFDELTKLRDKINEAGLGPAYLIPKPYDIGELEDLIEWVSDLHPVSVHPESAMSGAGTLFQPVLAL